MPERRRVSDALRRSVRHRAAGCCEYCRSQERFATQLFSVEHIVPRSGGGRMALDNLALACQGCNNHKYTKVTGTDPVSARTVPLFHPRRQRWQDHFIWSADFTHILGHTPTGRATIEALRLNRPAIVNLRRLLYEAGEHPPPEPEEGVGLVPSPADPASF